MNSKRKNDIKALFSAIDEEIDANDFQRKFYESMRTQFERTGDLSDRQMDCLASIYKRVTDV